MLVVLTFFFPENTNMVTKQDITRTIFTLCKDFIAPEKDQRDFKNSIVFMNGAWISFDEKTFTIRDQYQNVTVCPYDWHNIIMVECGKYGVTIQFGSEVSDDDCTFQQDYGLRIFNF